MQNIEDKIYRYLNQNCSKTELDEVKQWIKLSDDNKMYVDELQKLHQITSIDSDNFTPNVDAAWDKVSNKVFKAEKDNVSKLSHNNRMRHSIEFSSDSMVGEINQTGYRPAIRMSFGFVMKIAAMLLLGISLSYYFFFNGLEEITQSTVSTISGQIEQIELTDGTKVWVNENSSFKFPEQFKSDRREVYLDGVAFFDVAKNPERPFIIHSKNTYVQVLGTSFNLNTTADVSEVNVVTGKVALVLNSDTENKVILTKGERGVLVNGLMKKSKDYDANAMTWKTKKIVFKSTKIEEVVSVLEKHYKVVIKYNTNIANCLITSTFDNKSLIEILEVIKVIAQIDNTNQNGAYSLSGAGCE